MTGDVVPSPRRRTFALTVLVLISLTSPVLLYLLGAANAENTILRAENDRLHNRPPLVIHQPAPPPATTLPDVGRELRTGTLALPLAYCVDLDADWHITDAACAGRDLMVGFDFQGLRSPGAAKLALIPSERAYFAGCQTATPSASSLPYNELHLASFICVETDEHHVVLLEITTFEGPAKQPDKLTFKVTVWAR